MVSVELLPERSRPVSRRVCQQYCYVNEDDTREHEPSNGQASNNWTLYRPFQCDVIPRMVFTGQITRTTMSKATQYDRLTRATVYIASNSKHHWSYEATAVERKAKGNTAHTATAVGYSESVTCLMAISVIAYYASARLQAKEAYTIGLCRRWFCLSVWVSNCDRLARQRGMTTCRRAIF